MRFFLHRKKSITEKVTNSEKVVGKEVRELFIGRRTIFSLVGFIVGGVMVGNSLHDVIREQVDVTWAFVIGFILFVISGILSQQFAK